MTEEPDWSQEDPTKEQVEAWMRQHAQDFANARLLARAAHEHFHRPYHINVLEEMARIALEQPGD